MKKHNRRLMARPYEDTLEFTLVEFLRMSLAWGVLIAVFVVAMFVLSAVWVPS